MHTRWATFINYKTVICIPVFFLSVYKLKLLRHLMNYRIAACCPKVIFLRNFHTAQLLVHMRTAQSKSRIDVNFCKSFVVVVIGLQIYLSSDSLSYSRKTNNKIIDRTRFFNENFVSKNFYALNIFDSFLAFRNSSTLDVSVRLQYNSHVITLLCFM